MSAIQVQFAFTRAGLLAASVFQGSGASLTNLNASQLTTGLAAPARLGNGTANSGTFLRGDSTWQPVPGGIPSGLIAMFSTACPVGWTRVAALDGRFPIGSTGFGSTGGGGSHHHRVRGSTDNSGNHQHSFSRPVSGTTDLPDLQITIPGGSGGNFVASRSDHRHGFSATVSGNVDAGGAHTHAFDVQSDDESVTIMPPYLGVVFCQKD